MQVIADALLLSVQSHRSCVPSYAGQLEGSDSHHLDWEVDLPFPCVFPISGSVAKGQTELFTWPFSAIPCKSFMTRDVSVEVPSSLVL